jgi:3-methyladenine DNA glycosylase AlkC
MSAQHLMLAISIGTAAVSILTAAVSLWTRATVAELKNEIYQHESKKHNELREEWRKDLNLVAQLLKEAV